MTTDSEIVPDIREIELVEKDGERYLVNTAPVDIDRCRYCRKAWGRGSAHDEYTVTIFEVTDIPSQSAVQMHDDPEGTYARVWSILEIDWTNDHFFRGVEEGASLHSRWNSVWTVIQRYTIIMDRQDPPHEDENGDSAREEW